MCHFSVSYKKVYYPGFSPSAATLLALEHFKEKSYQVPIYYTWVERDKCG